MKQPLGNGVASFITSNEKGEDHFRPRLSRSWNLLAQQEQISRRVNPKTFLVAVLIFVVIMFLAFLSWSIKLFTNRVALNSSMIANATIHHFQSIRPIRTAPRRSLPTSRRVRFHTILYPC